MNKSELTYAPIILVKTMRKTESKFELKKGDPCTVEYAQGNTVTLTNEEGQQVDVTVAVFNAFFQLVTK